MYKKTINLIFQRTFMDTASWVESSSSTHNTINILCNFFKNPSSDSDSLPPIPLMLIWRFLLKPNFPRLIAKQLSGIAHYFWLILSNLASSLHLFRWLKTLTCCMLPPSSPSDLTGTHEWPAAFTLSYNPGLALANTRFQNSILLLVTAYCICLGQPELVRCSGNNVHCLILDKIKLTLCL